MLLRLISLTIDTKLGRLEQSARFLAEFLDFQISKFRAKVFLIHFNLRQLGRQFRDFRGELGPCVAVVRSEEGCIRGSVLEIQASFYRKSGGRESETIAEVEDVV
jgi:hypothetical protein